MKKGILFIALVFLSLPLFCQILNAGFEEWESFPSYDKPLHWETNQDTNFTRFIKDTISYDGDFALHAVPSGISAWSNCSSEAQIGVKLDTPISSNKSLFFYIRALSVNALDNTFANVGGFLYQDGNFISNYFWSTNEEFSDYTLIEIPLDNSMMIDSMTINIVAAKGNGATDGCFGASQVWFDNFYIDESSTTNIQNSTLSNITIFPNPANGEINLEGDFTSFQNYRIINLMGQELESGSVESSIIKINSVGVLFLILGNGQGETFVSKVINQK